MRFGTSVDARAIARLCGAIAAVGAAIYFVNGLTSPSARASVTVAAASTSAEVGASGWVTTDGPVGTFHYGALSSVSDRVFSRFGVVALLLIVAAIAFLVAEMAARHSAGAKALDIAAMRVTTTLGLAVAALGCVWGVAQWIQAATVLAAAGSPTGLEPRGSLDVGWLVAGGVIALGSGMARRSTKKVAEPAPVGVH